jgi:hypothetical protein
MDLRGREREGQRWERERKEEKARMVEGDRQTDKQRKGNKRGQRERNRKREGERVERVVTS